MTAYRCSTCGLDWPLTVDFKACARCEGACSIFANAVAMSVADATSLANHERFERFYAQREADRLTKEWADSSGV